MSDNSDIVVRVANASHDSPEMLAIYDHSIQTDVATFEVVSPTLGDFSARVEKIQRTHPWIVAELNGQVVGYAYASAHRPRIGYQWTTEVSVYVAPNSVGRGIGVLLYRKLMSILKRQGFRTVLAIISAPNPASEALHAKFGFEKIGQFDGIGFKFGQWQTTCWWQMSLQELEENPQPPVEFTDLIGTSELDSILV